MTKLTKLKISIIIDTRRKKKNNKYPVKIRIYSRELHKVKTFFIGVDLNIEEFKSIWTEGNLSNLRGKKRVTHETLQGFIGKAERVVQELPYFDFDRFENKFFSKSVSSKDLEFYFNESINRYIERGKIGTADSFKCAITSLLFFQKIKKKNALLKLEGITLEWLEDYESFMLESNKSISTIGIYLRSLRVVFNKVIDDGDLKKHFYPFGRKKYQIPVSKKVKKALTRPQLRKLYNSEPKTPEQQKAKDFWFLSYMCNGMNIKDILLLEHSDISNNKLHYYRAKTFSKKKEKKKIDVYLNEQALYIINTYKTNNNGVYVFPVIHKSDSPDDTHKKVKNFTRLINQHIKKIAIDNGLPSEISSYWARHSMATIAVREGANIELISELFDHSDVRVTKGYFDGFEDDTKKAFSEKLLKI